MAIITPVIIGVIPSLSMLDQIKDNTSVVLILSPHFSPYA
jgi:hypothetical protein